MIMEKLPKDFIPSFDELYAKTCEFVKEHQGPNGYIDTQDNFRDTIYTFDYSDGVAKEVEIKGVKVEDNNLLVVTSDIFGTCRITYTEYDFEKKENWESIKNGDLPYVFTLINIAEVINQYA